ncbi:MAG: winged helix-turn-helix domain-containing protein [archaeon]
MSPSTRRTKMEIIYDMLGSIRAKGGSIKPTHLMYKSNLSHKKMMEYVNELLEKTLITETETKEGKNYAITEAGDEFMAEYNKLKKFIDAFGF